MPESADSKREISRPLTMVRGELYAQPRQLPRPADDRRIWSLDRRMRTRFSAIEDANGHTPRGGIAKVRAGERRPWKSMGNRVLEAHDAGAPLHQVVAIADEFYDWIVGDVYGVDYTPAPTPIERAA